MTDRTLLARAVPWVAMLSCLVLVRPAGAASVAVLAQVSVRGS